MSIHGSKPLRFCFLSLLVISSLHCSREPNKSDGTQTTGGGNVFGSSKEQANEALDLALKLATEPDMTKNVFVQFWKDWGKSSPNELIAKPNHLFTRAETVAKTGAEVSQNERFESPVLMALSRNKILRADSDCKPTPTNPNTDGSVSSYSTDAEVCISIRNLMRLPPASLLSETLSLVLHEAIHMGGGLETEAVAWQTLFSSYFGARFGDLSPGIFAAETLKTMGVARVFLARATELAKANPKDPRLFAQMGRFAQTLDSLHELRDPLALELKLKPKTPALIPEYSSAVFGLIQDIQVKFEINHDILRVPGLPIPIQFMPPEKVVPSLEEASSKFEQINELFLRMAGRNELERPTCVTPANKPPAPLRRVGDIQEFPPKCSDD